jgi:hypothetical protein
MVGNRLSVSRKTKTISQTHSTPKPKMSTRRKKRFSNLTAWVSSSGPLCFYLASILHDLAR